MKLEDATHVYFACTGNTCRSPLAERILKEALTQRGIRGIAVQSRKADVQKPHPLVAEREEAFGAFGGGATFDLKLSTPRGISLAERISEGTEAVILEKYGDHSFVRQHKAQSFTPEELEAAGLVVVMSPHHKASLLTHPEAYTRDKKLKVYTFGDLVGQPTLDVRDPFGSDETLLAARAGFSPHQKKPTSWRAYLTADQERAIRIEAYRPTFDQLHQLITQIMGMDLPQRTFDEVFLERVRSYRKPVTDDTSRGGFLGLLDKGMERIGGWVASEPETVLSLYEKGDYTAALRKKTEETEQFIQAVLRVAGAYEALRSSMRNSPLKALAEAYKTRVHSEVVPLLLTGGTLATEFTVDKEGIARSLSPELRGLGHWAPTILPHTNRDQAFRLGELVYAALELANTLEAPKLGNELCDLVAGTDSHD